MRPHCAPISHATSSAATAASQSSFGLNRSRRAIVTGCGFGTDGQFYAVEFSTLGLEKAEPNTGALVKVPAHSTKPVTVVSGLSFPGGFAARGNALYLSNWSIAPANSGGGPTGQVVKVTP